ncbi:MAG: hypothetical protein ACRCWB_11915 [Enterovibrio sp.]
MTTITAALFSVICSLAIGCIVAIVCDDERVAIAITAAPCTAVSVGICYAAGVV